MPSASEELAARLARLRALLKELKHVSAESEHQRATSDRLHAEIEAARLALHLPKP